MHDHARRWILALSIAAACGGDDDENAEPDSTDGSTASSTASTGGTDSTGGIPTTSGVDDSTTIDTSAGDSSSSGAGVCVDEQPAIVTDIDETLTLTDAEFFMQVADPTYDPIEREGGSEMITAYAELGYRIMYLTARGENVDIADTEETSREITVRWLEEHGYPLDPATTIVVLSESLVVGDTAQAFKADALMQQQAMGWRFDYAYGNAITDIGAYEDAGIDKANTFIIGPEAGMEGTVAVEGDGWVEHTAEQLPTVPAVCEAA